MATIHSTIVPSAIFPFIVVVIAVVMHSTLTGAELSDEPSWKSSTENDAEDDGGGAVTWGLPDAVAPVGKLFEYRLNRDVEVGATGDDDAYVGFGLGVDGSGDVAGAGKEPVEATWTVYQVNGKGDRIELPDWLSIDAETNRLYGVADQRSLGHHYRLLVQHNGKSNNHASTMSDEFSIRVIDDTSSSWSEPTHRSSRVLPTSPVRTQSSKISPVRCPHGLSLTTATVVLDNDVTHLTASERVRLLVNFARHFRLPVSVFRIRPPPADRPLIDLNSALAAGPGDLVAGSTPLHAGLLVQWDVGCGNVRAELMPSLELLETSAADGRLGQALVGRPAVVGWHIAKMTRGGVVGVGSPRRSPKHAPRYVVPTATPAMPLVVMPTKRADIVTVTVQTPPPTAVVTAPTPTDVVIVPTATVTSPKATVTWPTTESSRGFAGSTTEREEIVETPQGEVTMVEGRMTMEHGSEAPMTSRTTWEQSSTSVPAESGVMVTDAVQTGAEVSETSSTSVLRPFTSTKYASTAPESTVYRGVMVTLQPSVASYEPTSSRHVPTTALPSTAAAATTPSVPASKATKRPPKTTTVKVGRQPNQPPEPRKPIGRLNVTAGKMLWFPIPDDTFVDREDGATSNLHLLLQKPDGLELTPMSWIKLNATSRTLFGLPMDGDVGRHQYILAAVDSEGRLAKSSFEVVVERGPSTAHISHEFSVILEIDYQEFLYKGVERRLEVASRLAAAFGDPDPSRITVTSIRSGSVVFSWTNNSIPTGPPCPTNEIANIAERVVDMNDGSTNADFAAAMYPLPVRRAQFSPLGACANEERLQPGGTIRKNPSVIEEPIPVTQSVDTLLLIVVVAMVVVGVLLVLLIILCIVCCCRARRRSEKQRRQRDDELSCANKGIPVIFADELDDDDDDDRKSSGTIGRGNGSQITPDDTPASTLKRRVRHADEVRETSPSPIGVVGLGDDDDSGQPRVPPPPQYPRSDPASRTSTLKSDYKAPLISDDDSDGDERLNEKPRSGNESEDQNEAGKMTTRPLYHPQPPNSDSLPPYKKL